MSPSEALKILEQVTGEINMSRAGHTKVIEALNVLKIVLDQKDGKN